MRGLNVGNPRLCSTQNASDNLCVFLSTASLQVGVWERADCERTRLGFACQLATHRPSQPPQGTLENDAASPGPLSAASDDQSCYLGTCYRLLPEAPKRTYFEAKAACGDAEVALPRNPLELAFLRARLASVSSVKRVWLGIEIEFSQGHLEFARGLVLTPWLTGAIHRSLPLSFFQSTSNHSETFCLQMDVAPSSSKDPFVAVPCTEAGAWNVTAFCAITETPRRACGDDNWYQFGEECFAVLSGCGNISGPANLKTPEQQAFAAWLIASSDYSDEKVLIGGTVNTASPLSITWSDGSVGTGFNRLKPALWQKDVSRNGLCLAMEPRTGWWVFSECEKQEFVLCSAPTPLEPTLPASVEQNTFAPDTTISCPEGYFLRLPKEDPSPVTCYRVVLGGVRSHTHDWRTAERTCRQVSAAGDASSRWVGHLASLPIASISDEVLSVLRQRGIETGIYALDNASKLPAHMIHTSDLVWIGLSRTESKLFWRKWTDGSDGDTAFYEDQIRQQRSFFADSPGYFFDHGSCIALHLPSGTWYPLRCTLDLGYLCQAVLTSSDQPEEVTENVDTPSCLVQPNGLHSVLSNETGFIHDPVVDCSAPGFTFFNGQCFRVGKYSVSTV
ncbi:unnamed protein product [Mesocestoides corti]|uniref:C-type lectin domain-containing protein n=2 Tax=Mesocestoides corti TaxID=53468 RepID=A0A0R3UBR4_MESCO|nr:unnamed protein product [Mesocestoides corti]